MEVKSAARPICATYADLERAVEDGRFRRDLFRITVITEARNELSHHNLIRERQKVVTACERTLDYLNLHLQSLDQDLQSQSYARPSFSVSREQRHRACRPVAARPS